MTTRIAVIGAGSNYTPVLIEALIPAFDEFDVRTLALMDVSPERLDTIASFVEHQLRVRASSCEVERHTEVSGAVYEAQVVLNIFRIGGLAARRADVAQAVSRGIVGQETQGWGGFASALRNAPAAFDVATILSRQRSNAWLINITNPVGIITRACERARPERVLGVCEMPVRMAEAIHSARGNSTGRFQYAGLNHLGWIVAAEDGDVNLMPELLSGPLGAILSHSFNPNIPSAHLESIARATRAIPSPYLRYYYEASAMSTISTIKSREDVCQEIDARLMSLYKEKGGDVWRHVAEHRGGFLLGPTLLKVLRGLLTDAAESAAPCIRNGNSIPFLAPGAIIETSATICDGRITASAVPPLHPHMQGLMSVVAAYEELTVEAALSGDLGTALAALACHPLVRDVSLAGVLLEETIRSNAQHLPRFQ
ncbi:MAG TPA: hypothetical protein VHX14_25135 [Thermoanaerobaculia bacterium]|nr:hypothetical protein [Thermoanaerobaculia bacterium]